MSAVESFHEMSRIESNDGHMNWRFNQSYDSDNGCYKDLMKRIPENKKGEFYLLLESHELLSVDTATKENIFAIHEIVKPLFEKMHSTARPKARIVDFNQGLDSRLITNENMRKLAEVCIRPLRIAFDHWELRDTYVAAIRMAADAGISELSNYLLYNYNDKPEELYYRLKLNAELCEELNVSIYSFPMKYHPIDNEDFFSNRDYIGKNWNRKFIRAVQAVLNSTKGCIGRGLDLFYEAFGIDEKRFWTIMWMPESFIIYRMKFKDNLAKKWEKAFWNLSEEKLVIVKKIVAENRFSHFDLTPFDDEIRTVLEFYLIDRDAAKEMIID